MERNKFTGEQVIYIIAATIVVTLLVILFGMQIGKGF